MKHDGTLGWLGILRLGLVQAAIGSVVVLTTSTINRVMVVELALPAMLPGLLVALHYFVQVLRPRLGYGSDAAGGRRAPWIVGGMAMLGAGAVGAAFSVGVMGQDVMAGIAIAIVAFLLIGIGVGGCGTALLVLLSKRVAPQRLAGAATVTWLMMIFGFIVTTVIVGKLLDPYSPQRLLQVATGVAVATFVLTWLAVFNVEGRPGTPQAVVAAPQARQPPFREALREVWAEPQARRLSVFIFLSMLAYSAQDLILEPFAGTVFGMTPAESTKLSGVQNSGVMLGMLAIAVLGSSRWSGRFGSMRLWTVVGCIASALALFGLTVASFVGPAWPLKASVFLLGLANGTYAVAAIGSMMGLVSSGTERREGTRMGLWGAAQAIAFALGGLAGTVAVDAARLVLGSSVVAYAAVFGAEAVLFAVSTGFAVRLSRPGAASDDARRSHDQAYAAAATGRQAA
jgi:BCD family chlorophyll transporter-like MFS transporter